MSALHPNYQFANQSEDLFGFRFDFTSLRPLQLELKNNYQLDNEGRANIREQLGNRFQNMYMSAMALLSSQCACATCGDRPLVRGSRHEMLPQSTLKMFRKLEERISGKSFSYFPTFDRAKRS
jgi:hypothetical protein